MDTIATKSWEHIWTAVDGIKPQKGGQGFVTKVRRSDGTLGALKEMLPDSAHSKERRARMAKEVIGLQRSAGEGVPRVLDHNMAQVDDPAVALYLVQEWVEGRTLDQFDGRPMCLDDALVATRELAEIVKRCHENGVLHRDIKPENIIRDTTGKLHLVDFGIAWLHPEYRPEGDPRTKVGQELGNRSLRLPELSAGQEKANPCSDVTFLVGILFFLTTGVRPRSLSIDDSGLKPHEAHVDKFPEATRSDSRYTARLVRLFNVGFQFVPNLRFPSASSLIEKLNEMIARPIEELSRYAEQEARFDAMMEHQEVEQRRRINEALRQIAREFEEDIRVRCERKGLVASTLAGGPQVKGGMVESPIQILHQALALRIEGRHTFRQESPSEVAAFSSIGRHVGVYYQGPLADTDRLREEAMRHAEEFFGAALEEISQRISGRREIEG